MLVTIKVVKLNSKLSRLLEVRPIVALLKSHYSDVDGSTDILKQYTDAGNFSERYKPLTVEDYGRFISTRSSKREPALTRQITSLAYEVDKNMISLAEGMPNEEVFPFSKLTLELKSGGEIVMDQKELATALQYVPSRGLPDLVSALKKFQQYVHRPPPIPAPREILITNGAQHAIYQCCELFVEPGDPVVMTEYAYTGLHTALKPYNPEIIGIPEDVDGMIPEKLESILQDRLTRGLRMPKILYIIPTGNNPTGTVTPEDRRRQIYELACKYDFLILEDDPYMFLNYTETVIPTFLSMDSCGRVVRMDSLSKVVSAGLRAAWLTAPAPLIARLELHTQAEILHSCTLSQAVQLRLMADYGALAAQLRGARALYAARRGALHAALHAAGVAGGAGGAGEGEGEGEGEGLGAGGRPAAGLFVWLRVRGVEDVYNMVFDTAFQRGLMLIPGHAFQYDTRAPCSYIRLTFSRLPAALMPAAARHLAEIIKIEQASTLQKRPQRLATEG